MLKNHSITRSRNIAVVTSQCQALDGVAYLVCHIGVAVEIQPAFLC